MAVRRVRLILAFVILCTVVIWYYRSYGSSDAGNFLYGAVSDSYAGDKWGNDQSYVPDSRWTQRPPQHPVAELLPFPTGPFAKIPRIQAEKSKEDTSRMQQRLTRLEAVKESFLHSWGGYKKHAWKHDEVRPLTGESNDPFGGWAATLVDALDTLWIMGLTDEFEAAIKDALAIDFGTTRQDTLNVFETTIRYLGGFLAAYELSKGQYPALLAKAREVGELVLCAFDTPNHMPHTRWGWRAYAEGAKQGVPGQTLVSEIGSLSLEFTKLSQLTGDMRWHDAAQRISNEIERGQQMTSLPGMWPIVVDPSSIPFQFPGNTYTLGGMSDSLYEYFPKQWLLLGGALNQPRKLYENFIEVAKKLLLKRAYNPENLPIVFPGDIETSFMGNPEFKPATQHLTCFTGGMVGLAAKAFDRPQDMDLAMQLTDACVWAYNATPSGLAPETFTFIPCDPDTKSSSSNNNCVWNDARWLTAAKQHYRPQKAASMPNAHIQTLLTNRGLVHGGILEAMDPRYILRPEAIESVFLMWRLTGDVRWQDKAWAMFEKVERHTRTPIAAAALQNVMVAAPQQVDSMESFWLAETLKYYYLVFSEWGVIDLDEWVLNTEAHPLRRADRIEKKGGLLMR